MQDLKADPQAPLDAVIIESSLDPKKGPLATLIVKNGTLKIGDNLQAEAVSGKVKALFDDSGNQLTQVLSGQPAQVLGFKTVPPVGSRVTSSTVPALLPPQAASQPSTPTTNADTKKLKLILKADTLGTLEAITQNLGGEVSLISSGVGDVTESDVLLADSTGATILAFRVNTTSSAKKLADIEAILIKSYSLIHELLEDVQQQILKLLEPTIDEKILGEAKVIAEFTVQGQRIAGLEVISGKLTVGDPVHLQRGQDQLKDAKIKSLHQGKEAIDKAKKGDQCGVLLTPQLDFKLKDKLIAYQKI
jgi:translation initiation factor IF-2